MIFNKRAVSYPLLLVPFIFILIALFSISITSPKSDIEESYGGVGVEVDTFIREHQLYSKWFELGFEDAYYRQFAYYLESNVFSSCLQNTEFFQENKLLIYDEVLLESNSIKANVFSCFESLENSNSYLDIYEGKLDTFFSSIERPGEDISFDIEPSTSEVRVNVTSIFKRTREGVEMEHKKTYLYSMPLLKIEDFMSSSLVQPSSIAEFKTRIQQCEFTGDISLEECYQLHGEDMFSVVNSELDVVLEQDGETYDFIVFRYVLTPGVDIEFRMRLRI